MPPSILPGIGQPWAKAVGPHVAEHGRLRSLLQKETNPRHEKGKGPGRMASGTIAPVSAGAEREGKESPGR